MDSFQALCYLVTCQHLIPISTVCFFKHSLFGFLGQPPLGFPVLTLHPSPDWLGPLEARMHACSVIQLCLTLCNLMDCSPPGSSWDFLGKNTGVSCHFPTPGDLPDPGIQPASPLTLALAGRFFYHWATWETLETFDVIQPLSHVQLFAAPWTAACQASLSFTIRLMSIE